MTTCICCGQPGRFSIELAVGPQEDKGRSDECYYLPNQGAREMRLNIRERWFCADHMRAVEDNLRTTIGRLQVENGAAPIVLA